MNFGRTQTFGDGGVRRHKYLVPNKQNQDTCHMIVKLEK